MAAPAVRSVGTFASGTTTCTPGLPAGWAENDIFVLISECDDSDTPNNPTGYTFLNSGISGTDVKLSVWVKRATASESAPTVDGTSNHVHAVIAAVQGADTAGSPWLLGAFTDNNGVGAGGSFASITTTVADALVLLLSAIGDNANDADNLSAYSNSNLASLTEHQDEAETTGTGGGTGIASGVKAATGAVGISTATHDNAVAWATVHLAIYPSSTLVDADAEVAWTELEVPTANSRADVAWTELEVPTANSRADVSWAEFETPTADARSDVSWTEFEVPFMDARADVAWAEFEVPTADSRADVAWAEFEVPNVDARADVSWAEFEVTFPDSRADVSWAEFEVPTADSRADISWSELEVPTADSRSDIAFAEMEFPVSNAQAEVAWAEVEVPDVGGGGGTYIQDKHIHHHC